jgi:dipeptidyl aminopeptidase/acylaminoacyl peptidase
VSERRAWQRLDWSDGSWLRWAGVAAAIAVVAVGVIAVFLLRDDGGEPASLPSGTWVALLNRAIVSDNPTEPAPILLRNLDTGEERQLGQPADYGHPVFSPDGRRLAVIDLDSGHLQLLETAGSGVVHVDGENPVDWAWSPDGSRLVVTIMPGRLVMVSADGKVLGDLKVANPEPGVSLSGGGGAWSPDSRSFAAVINGRLMLFDRNGAGEAFEAGRVIADATGSALTVHSWKDRETLVVIDRSVPFGYYAVLVRDDRFEATTLTPDEARLLLGDIPPGLREQHEQVTFLRNTADGSGRIFTFRQPREGFAVVVGDDITVVEQSHGSAPGLRGALDVVIVR